MKYAPFVRVGQCLNGATRLYSRRAKKPEFKNKLRLAPTVSSKTGSTAHMGAKKRSAPSNSFNKSNSTRNRTSLRHKESSTFHYGNFGGLKESGDDAQKSTKLISKITDFDQLKILPVVRNAIKNVITQESIASTKAATIRPSPIQIVSIRKLASSLMDPKLQLHAIAAETGSGKTIAYLVPLLDYLKRQENECQESWDSLRTKPIIRSIILVPTHELVEQVSKTISQMEDLLGMRTCKWGSGVPHTELLEQIKNRIDILVTTPAKLLSLYNIRMISRPDKILSQVKFVVLDEADTLLDQSWVDDTHSAIRKMPNANHMIFCSATIPNEFNKTLGSLFPTVVSITTPRLHKLPNSVEFKVIDASLNPFKGSKIKALAQVLYAISDDGTEPNYEKRCIVFVNEKKKRSRYC